MEKVIEHNVKENFFYSQEYQDSLRTAYKLYNEIDLKELKEEDKKQLLNFKKHLELSLRYGYNYKEVIEKLRFTKILNRTLKNKDNHKKTSYKI